jgi:arsenite methyltransferase
MAASEQDIWSRWIFHRRFGGDRQRTQYMLHKYLYPIRDEVLSHAGVSEGDTLLDVGCGDGLIAFGALERHKTAKVIFSDISQDLLDHVQAIARDTQATSRCQFLLASADDLSALKDSSVDVVTTRSVLVYVSAKQKAFNEFHRVLKSQGRLSIFEPINRFSYPEPMHLCRGYDVTPIIKIAEKVKDVYLRLQPSDTDPMVDFDERDLIVFAERAGFKEVHLELRIDVQFPTEGVSWEIHLRSSGNPRVPTLEEAIKQALTPDEARAFAAHLRPLVEAGQGTERLAVAYLWAIKG